MIDIHCHILPGIDDGAQTIEDSLGIIRAEVEGGTTAFVATPHFIEKVDYNRIDKLPGLIAQVKEAMASEGIVAEIYQGGEMYPSQNMITALDDGLPVTVANMKKHMLVDLPLSSFPNDIDTLLYELKLRGVTPIIAHPERAAFIVQDPERIDRFAENGYVFQVNAPSLFGRYGPVAQEFALKLLRRRKVHFLSSDSHRPPRAAVMQRALEFLEDEIDADYLALLTTGSAQAVIEGRELPGLPPAPANVKPEMKEKKGFFARLRGR